MEMMKGMDPKAMAGMMKSATGKEMSEEQIAQVQSMMSNMSEEDMMKWSGRMQRLAGWAQKPGGAGPSGAGGMPDMANMDMSNAAEMMGKMNPDMMKAGMEMMKGMDPKAMAGMMKSATGKEMSEEQIAQVQ